MNSDGSNDRWLVVAYPEDIRYEIGGSRTPYVWDISDKHKIKKSSNESPSGLYFVLI